MEITINIILFFITGIIAGSFGGLLGLGGAVIMVPALTLFFGLPIHLAIAISLISNIFVSITAVLRYQRKGFLHKKTVMIMNIGSIAGIITGTIIASVSPAGTIKVFFGAFLLVLIVDVVMRKDAAEREPVIEPEKVNAPGLSALGFVMGILGALLGVGGGTVAVPVQTNVFKIPLKNAIANSLGTIVISASLGALLYFYLGSGRIFSAEDALLTSAAIVPGSVIGARLGVRISEHVPTKHVKYIFYSVLLYIAYNMIKSGLGW